MDPVKAEEHREKGNEFFKAPILLSSLISYYVIVI